MTARGARGRTVAVDSANITFEARTANSKEIAINVGSNASFTDKDGRVWLEDKPHSAGSWGYRGERAKQIYSAPPDRNVLGTDSDPLFQTMVEGLSEYKFDVPGGEYEVELLFAETKFDLPGKRVFDVLINDVAILSRFDLAASAGIYRTSKKTTHVVSKGGLSIRFVATRGEPVLSGIRIIRLSAP